MRLLFMGAQALGILAGYLHSGYRSRGRAPRVFATQKGLTVRYQEEALACIECAAATKKKQVGGSNPALLTARRMQHLYSSKGRFDTRTL